VEVDVLLTYISDWRLGRGAGKLTFRLNIWTLFGEVGAAIPFSVREVQNGKGSAAESGKGLSTKGDIVIEVLDSGLDRLRAAATLQGTYQGQEACFTTIAVSSSFSPALKDNL